MELSLEGRENSKCSKQVLQRTREIIKTGLLLFTHTFIVHRQCCLKFSPCTGVVLLEEWTMTIVSRKCSDNKVLDCPFLKNAMRSYFHFLQVNSGVTCSEKQLLNDGVCKYKCACFVIIGKVSSFPKRIFRNIFEISVNGVRLDDLLKNFEIHKFPLRHSNSLLHVYVTVKWRKYDASPHLSLYYKSARSFSDDWLLLSPAFFAERNFGTSSPCVPFFCLPMECQKNNEEEKIKSEYVEKGSVTALKTSCDFTSCKQLLIKDNHASNSLHLYSDLRIYQLFNFRKDAKVRDEKTLLGNEQTVKLPVVESLLSLSASSTKTGFPLQAVPTSSASRREILPRRSLIVSAFRFMSTASKAFSKTTGLPLNSSPAPFNRSETKFAGDQPLKSTRNKIAEKDARKGTRANILRNVPTDEKGSKSGYYEKTAIQGGGCIRRSITSSSGLLCNFEESALNGRLDLVKSLDGFHLQIAASDETFFPHLTLPVTTFFFNMPEDEAPLPYMGFCSLGNMRKGYRIPRKGILQAVLFNPQDTVVRMFVVKFDVSDMPPSSQTFLRQRTFFMPVGCTYDGVLRSWLKYLIHLSLATDRRGRLYVHTDIRMLFSQKNELETLNFELGKDMIKYQLQSFTEMPRNPKYSPRK